MKKIALCLFLFPLTALTSGEERFAPEMLTSAPPMQGLMIDSTPSFDLHKAMNYLESLHGYLKSLGGKNLYAELKNKSEEELVVIRARLEELLAPISQNLETGPYWCGGIGSMGLVGLFLSLDDLLTALSKMKEEKSVSAKIVCFFKYIGCRDTIFSLFL